MWVTIATIVLKYIPWLKNYLNSLLVVGWSKYWKKNFFSCSRIKRINLFKNLYLSLARLVSILLCLKLRPRWNNVEIMSYKRWNNVETASCNVEKPLYQRCATLFWRQTLALYQRFTTLKMRRQTLFHFQRQINIISTLKQR